MPEKLTCPFCNALTPSLPGAGRVVCSRCGESFSTAESHGHQPCTEFATATVPPSGRTLNRAAKSWAPRLALASLIVFGLSLALKLGFPDFNLTQRAFPFMGLLAGMGLTAAIWGWFLRGPRANRAVAFFVLANMAAMAVMVLPFALAKTSFRRSLDPRGIAPVSTKNTQEPETAPPVIPARLAGLGYLPDDFNLVAGIHVADLAADPGSAWLRRRDPKAEEGEPNFWLLELGLGRVEKMSGLKASDLDHLVLGLKIGTGFPTLMLVAETQQPYDPETIARAQGKVVPIRHEDRLLYQFKTPPFGEGMLFCPNSKTVVIALRFDAQTVRDRQMLKAAPRAGTLTAPASIRRLLEERVAVGTQIWWAASDLDRPELALSLLPLGNKDPEVKELLERTRALTAGLRVGKTAVLLGNVQAADAESARRLSALLLELPIDGLGRLKVAGPEPGSASSWVTFQAQGDMASVISVFRPVQLFGRPGKQ